MNGFLITFKPRTESPRRGWDMQSMLTLARRVQKSDRPVVDPWRFYNKRDAKVGDRAFLLLQGKLGPSIIGYGKLTHQSSRKGQKPWRGIAFEKLVDPERQTLVAKEKLLAIAGSAPWWRVQRSGILLPRKIAEQLERLAGGKQPTERSILPINVHVSRDGITEAVEGEARIVTHQIRERDPRLGDRKRNEAFLRFGTLKCEVCSNDFTDQYGSFGSNVIECHHTLPLSKLKSGRRTRLEDLALVCANCHRVLHAGGNTVASLRR
jgi:HNH endonuclease